MEDAGAIIITIDCISLEEDEDNSKYDLLAKDVLNTLYTNLPFDNGFDVERFNNGIHRYSRSSASERMFNMSKKNTH